MLQRRNGSRGSGEQNFLWRMRMKGGRGSRIYEVFIRKRRGPANQICPGLVGILVVCAASPAAAAATLARLITIAAVNGAVATGLEGDSSRLSAAGADHRCSLSWS